MEEFYPGKIIHIGKEDATVKFDNGEMFGVSVPLLPPDSKEGDEVTIVIETTSRIKDVIGRI
ncbi:hypothetical protein ACFL13_02040 [Patescibacteria group bacterium]